MFNDASNVNLEEKYDLIFIDAAKAQNKKFFLTFEHNLKKGGYIITDNINFHGLVKKELEEIETKSNLCCPYTHWSMVKLPVASPLKRTSLHL